MFELLIIAFSLGLDAFSLAVSFGMYQKECTLPSKLRITFSFGLFQFLMPILGFVIGGNLIHFIDRYDHWIVFLILFLVGCKMIFDSLQADDIKKSVDISTGIPLLIASIATSLDAFAVGISFALLKRELFFSSIVIGITAAMMSWIGVNFGNHIGRNWIKKPEFIGGIVIIAIGIKSLIQGL